MANNPYPNPKYAPPGTSYNRYKGQVIPSNRGLSYPLELDGRGGLKTVEDVDLVKQQILSVLETLPFERVMRQDYGTPDQILNAMNPILTNLQVKRALEMNVPNATSIRVEGDISKADDGVYNLRIYWTHSNTGAIQPPINVQLES